MRVLYFVERFWPYIGGVEVVSARVLPELVRRGIDVTIVTCRDDLNLAERDTYEGVDVRRLRMDQAMRSADVEAIAEIQAETAAIKREVEPDLVHIVLTGACVYFPVMTANVAPAPTLLSVHGSWPPVHFFAPVGLLRRALAISDRFTACSDSALVDLLAVDDSIAGRAETILNGLDPPPFEPSPLPFDPPVLLCAARIQPEKGIDVAIDAVRLLRDEFPDIRLRIVGDGIALGDLTAQVARLGLEGSVELAGWRSPEDIPRLVDEATIVLVPSRLEGFGLIALEGMLGTRPVVATRVGGLPEVLGDDGGLLVEPESPEAIAGAVSSLLRDPAHAQSVAAAGRRRAQAVFPLRRSVDAYESLYRTLTANGHAS